jgi:type 1 glutamine amidotransferase
MPLTDAVIISGGRGRYSDPWHPYSETSARVFQILESAGFRVTVTDSVEEALAELPETTPALVVVNVGLPRDGDPSPMSAAPMEGLGEYLAHGGAALVLHCSSTSFVDAPEWEEILGGRWIREVSMHPDQGEAEITVTSPAHPICSGVGDFTLYDERYSFLRTSPAIDVLATHQHEGVEHPVLWTNSFGGGRVVYDALGHDVRSFDSPDHWAVLVNAARWLTAE